jgi:hypothetical protein
MILREPNTRFRTGSLLLNNAPTKEFSRRRIDAMERSFHTESLKKISEQCFSQGSFLAEKLAGRIMIAEHVV